MSEQKQSSFMQELDRWTEATVIYPLADTPNEEFDPQVVEVFLDVLGAETVTGQAEGELEPACTAVDPA